MAKPKDTTESFEEALQQRGHERLVLRLYIAGTTPNSARALSTIKEICNQYFEGRYDLEVVDIYQQPVLAADEQIVAVPTLIKRLPLPLRRLIGDLSDRDHVLIGLDLKNASSQRNATKDDEKKRSR